MASFAISQQPLPWPTASHPPPPPLLPSLPLCSPHHPHWNCKEDQNKERDLFFTRLLLWPNDITSAASSPQIPAAQHIFPFFAVDPPFYLNSTILYLYQNRLLKNVCFCRLCPWAYAAHHFSATRIQSEPIQKINETYSNISLKKQKTKQEAVNKTDGCFDIISQCSPKLSAL